VCKSWRDEVGTKSPLLWKMLLQRRKWLDSVAIQEKDIGNDDANGLNAFKNAFISHYVAARDIRAIVSACSQVCGGIKGFDSSVVDSDFVLQRYKSTAGAPMFEDDILLMRQLQIGAWTESKYEEKVRAMVLAAFPDLTLRLFEAIPRSHSSSAVTPTKCRQIACIGVLPTSLTQKKSSCRFKSLAIDEDDVCCMFSAVNDDDLSQNTSSYLSVVSRDNLVCAGNDGLLDDHSMHQFDLRAMVLDFLLSGAVDDTNQDHLQTALHDYLALRDGETSLIKVIFSSTLFSCGKGHFLTEAYIDIPFDSESEEDDSDDERSHSSGNKLFVISIKKGKAQIVKSMHLGSYGADMLGIHASEPYKLHQDTKNPSSGRKTCTNLFVISNDEGLNLSLTISRNGVIDMQMKSVIDRHQFFQEFQHMEAVVTSSSVVEVTISPDDTRLIFFCDGGYETYPVGGPTKLFDIFCIREEYVAIILGTENDDDAIGGEWFGIEEGSTTREVVVYHITSHQEVFRYPLPDVSLNVRCIGDTIAANISNLGFVIAGENAREVARTALDGDDENTQTPTKTTKSKKKRLASLASGRKKDGFARGMSMRG
jgi:hypothetical protein